MMDFWFHYDLRQYLSSPGGRRPLFLTAGLNFPFVKQGLWVGAREVKEHEKV